MERPRRTAAVLLIVLVGASLSVIACSFSILALPNAVPPVEEFKDLALAGSVLDIVSVETDDRNILLFAHYPLHLDSWSYSFFGNRKLWCDALVAALSEELSKRGATILPSAGTRFTVGLPQISRNLRRDIISQDFRWSGPGGFEAKAAVRSTAGWAKTYEGRASAAAGMTYRSRADRAVSYIISELVKAMLADPAFISQIKASKP